MNKATLRLYKVSGLVCSAGAIAVVILGHIAIMQKELSIPLMLTLLGMATFCCANTQKETGSLLFSRFCIACGVILMICAITLVAIDVFMPMIIG